MKGRLSHADEDYGDYITRCICTFTHDDGYMICCDECSVWQHVECMKVDPKNLPDKYLCEECEPRPVDKKRAKLIQIKKKEEMSGTDFDDDDSVSTDDGHRSGSSSPVPSSKRRKKQHQKAAAGTLRVQELKAEARRGKREKDDIKKGKKKSKHHVHHHSSTTPSMLSGVQTLLTAASALEQQLVPISPPTSSLWSSTSSPWQDPYDSVETNSYSEQLSVSLSSCLSQLKQEAVVYSREEFQGLGPHPLCLVREVVPFRKGVVSEANIPEDEMIMEYKGSITTKQALIADMNITSLRLLWKSKPCPFIYQYDKMSDVHVCIDARQIGNSARYIRRSCSPNSELRHFFVDNEVHFGIYALHHISPNEEITIGFDFSYDKCDYPVECACGQKTACLLLTMPRTYTRGRGKRQQKEPAGLEPSVFHDEESNQSRKIKGRGSHPVDEDSNSSWLNMSTSKRVKHNSTSQQASDSDSEDNIDSDAHQRRKSREERKTEAVWKMFEKMEASRRKRQQHLPSIDNSREISPSVSYSTPRTKERTSSNGHKVQLLPTHKSRLASTSSVDLLSPEPIDAFSSPPLTPSLSTISLHDQSSNDHTSSPPWSNLPKLSFEVTPYLHPKYLLADFALPRKKAILRQWEMEQLEPVGSNGSGSAHRISNGFALACAKAMEGKKVRTRGSIKHRWMKRYTEIDMANLQNEIPIYHKKKFLQKWEHLCHNLRNETLSQSSKNSVSSSLSDTTIDTTAGGDAKGNTERGELEEATAGVTVMKETTESNETQSEMDTQADASLTHVDDQLQNRSDIDETKDAINLQEVSLPSSPLFDDFSDDEFDSNETPKVTEVKSLKDLAKESEENFKRQEELQEQDGKLKDSTTYNALFTSPVTDDNDIHALTPPTKSPNPQASPSLTSAENTSSETLSDEKTFSKNEATLDDGEELSNNDSIEMELSSTPPPPAIPDGADAHQPYKPHPPIELDPIMSPVVSSGECFIESNKPAAPMTESDDKPHLGAKRKMSLLEYRNRSKKPVDPVRKATVSQESSSLAPTQCTSPSVMLPPSAVTLPLVSPNKSFLSFSSSFLSNPAKHLKSTGSPSHLGGGGGGGAIASAESVPQFEPVSPDEELTEDSSTRGGVGANGGSVPSTASLTTGVMAPTGFPYSLSPQTNVGTPGGQFLWHQGLPPPPPAGIDMTQDPRRVQQSITDTYSLHPQLAPPPPQSIPVPPPPRFPSPYPSIIHPHPIMSHSPHDFMTHQSRATGGFIPHPQVPRPPMLHPPGHTPRHSGNNYY